MKPLFALLSGLLSLAVSATGSQVVVLDDFETGTVKAWQGAIRISSDHASHGSQAGRITLQRGAAEVSLAPSQRDWKAFDRLLFDV